MGGSDTPARGETFFTIGIFRNNTSKYAKLIIEFNCDSLNQFYRFFLIFNKAILKFINILEIRLEGKRLISAVHV